MAFTRIRKHLMQHPRCALLRPLCGPNRTNHAALLGGCHICPHFEALGFACMSCLQHVSHDVRMLTHSRSHIRTHTRTAVGRRCFDKCEKNWQMFHVPGGFCVCMLMYVCVLTVKTVAPRKNRQHCSSYTNMFY